MASRSPTDDDKLAPAISTLHAPPADLRSYVLRRLTDPLIVRSYEASLPSSSRSSSALTRTPWICHPHRSGDDGATPPDGSRGVSRKRDDRGQEWGGGRVLPPYNYLDLRARQNKSWATTRLKKGVEHAERAAATGNPPSTVTGEWSKAEACYKEGLDLCPSHPELLVAYGALCANRGRDEEARRWLEKAVEVTIISTTADFAKEATSGTAKNARIYLAEVEKRLMHSTPAMKSAFTSTSAYASSTVAGPSLPISRYDARVEQRLRDALAERAFLSGGSKVKGAEGWGGYEAKHESDLPLAETKEVEGIDETKESPDRELRRKRRSPEVGRQRGEKHRRRKRNKKHDGRNRSKSSGHHRHHRRRRSRSRSRSSGGEDSSSSSSSSQSSSSSSRSDRYKRKRNEIVSSDESRRRRRKGRRRKKRREHHSSEGRATKKKRKGRG